MAKEILQQAKNASIVNANNFFSYKRTQPPFFKSSNLQVQKKPAAGKTTAAAKKTWKDKLAAFDHDKSSEAEIKVFYKDLLEQEILDVFSKTEVVDVLLKGDTNCNPAHLTLMLEIGDGKLADYAAPDTEKEEAARIKRRGVDLDKTNNVNTIALPEVLCRRIFLNDIDKDHPQRFHAAYFHEAKHDDHRQLYIKYFTQWKDKFKKSKKPKGFLTWIRETLANKKHAVDLAIIEEDHFSTTGTLFNEAVAHLKTLEWLGAQKATTEDAIKTRFSTFIEYASNIVDNVTIIINAFVIVYKNLPENLQKAIAAMINAGKDGSGGDPKRYQVFYTKLAEKI